MKRKKNKTIANENSQSRCMGNRDNKENISEIQKDFSGNVVPLTFLDIECKALVDSDRRAIELSRKGIFACPKYNDLFITIDDARMK